MIKRMFGSYDRGINYRVNVAGLMIEFPTIEEAFTFAHERLGKDNYPVIKNGNIEWWSKTPNTHNNGGHDG